MGRTIEKGDLVEVVLMTTPSWLNNYGPGYMGTILSAPCATGDMWYIEVTQPEEYKGSVVAQNPSSLNLDQILKVTG